MRRELAVLAAVLSIAISYTAAFAASTPVPLPPKNPFKNPDLEKGQSSKPANVLFSEKKLPSLGEAMAIGYYPRGCLQGGVELPTTGPTWQVVRVSRNRNWGHPELVKFLERFAPLAAKATGRHGILVGDMAQPRGGPLPFGHKSHQVGLDVDIWFMPMPDHVLNQDERDKIVALDLVAANGKDVDRKKWTSADVAFIRTAAEQPEVERVLVNAAIKKELCRAQGERDKSLKSWFADWILRLKIPDLAPSSTSGLKLKDLPPACTAVLNAPAKPNDKA